MKKSVVILFLTALILTGCAELGEPTVTENSPETESTALEDNIISPALPIAPGIEVPTNGKTAMSLITLDEAKAAALAYAKVTDAVFAQGEQELSDGRYEFFFTAGDVEYEVYVAGGTGEITHFKTDKDVGIPNFPEPITAPDLPSAPVLPT